MRRIFFLTRMLFRFVRGKMILELVTLLVQIQFRLSPFRVDA